MDQNCVMRVGYFSSNGEMISKIFVYEKPNDESPDKYYDFVNKMNEYNYYLLNTLKVDIHNGTLFTEELSWESISA